MFTSSASSLPNSFKANAIDSAVDRASRNGCLRIGLYMLSFSIFCSEIEGKSFNQGIRLYIRLALYQVLSRTTICVFFLFKFRFLYSLIDIASSLGHKTTISYSSCPSSPSNSSVTAVQALTGTSSFGTVNAFGHEQSRQTTSQFSTMFLAIIRQKLSAQQKQSSRTPTAWVVVHAFADCDALLFALFE
ncbi:unnamed protein product [Bathycoccus prasinos]